MALETFGLDAPHFRLLRVAGNTLFRVYESNPDPEKSSNGLFEPGQYLLRIHHWIYDLAVSLERCQEEAAFARCREALLNGYTQFRSLPQEQLKYFDLFQAGFHIFESLWCVAAARVYTRHREELSKRLERAARLVVRYLESC